MEESLFSLRETGGIELWEVMDAYKACRRHKRNTINALRFELNWEVECVSLWEDINSGTYRPGRSIAFIVTKPTKREIFAADFRDRVVHHLIAQKIVPLLESQFINDSYSTREGRGTLYGIHRVEEQIRQESDNYTRDCYVMKLDIEGFFMAINKRMLYAEVEAFLRERYHANDLPLLLWLIRLTVMNRPEQGCVFRCPRRMWRGLPKTKSLLGTDGTHGLPIGNLTSQLLALLHLDGLDHLVREEWGVEGYGRYVDDMVFVSRSRRRLLEVRGKVGEWLTAHGHRLHPKKMYLQHYSKGVLFIGGMILPGRKFLSRRTVRFMRDALEACHRLVGGSTNPPLVVKERVRATMNSYFGMLQHYDALRLTSHIICQLPKDWFQWMYVVRQGHRCKMVVKQTL